MYAHLFKPIFLTTSLIFFTLPQFLAKDNEQYSECSRPLQCGENYQKLKFPFWGANLPLRCGLAGFEVICVNNDFTAINISSDYRFRVLGINESTQEIRLARDYTPTEFCPQKLESNKLNEGLFTYDPYKTEELHLFDECPNYNQLANISINSIRNFTNDTCWGKWIANSRVFNETFSEAQNRYLGSCKTKMKVLVNATTLEEFRYNMNISLQQLLNEVFVVNYKRNYDVSACDVCTESGGLCWSGTVLSPPTCLCPNGISQGRCRKRDKLQSTQVIIGTVAGASSATFIVLALCIYYRRKRSHDDGESFISRNPDFYPSSSTSHFEKPASTYKGVPLFSYNELKKATNNFDSRKELGDGGYGKVYKGKLGDERVVAVKRLYESNYKRVEQFMNEIEILTRLRHHNLVSLYGCTSHQCQQLLLVYEFIRNGTIADHLYGERSKPISLTWKTRMNIAIETASALSYLHASDVIHRDVKTTNILLDDNYCVKVADFGLSRLFPFNVTHVSTAPQGTPGYVDPEYQQCYQLTDKSDVFSFGVVLIELISSMPAVDFSRHRDEINLSNMAINKIQNNSLHELVDPSLGYESDYVARKMITQVAELAFRCLQNGRDFRPTMKEVLNTLMEIKSRFLDTNKSMDIHTSADDALLLKNCPELLSPDSVTVKWNSNLTKSISSG